MNLRDDKSLLEALANATPDPRQSSAQRVSFVVSSLEDNISVTRERVMEELRRKDAIAAL